MPQNALLESKTALFKLPYYMGNVQGLEFSDKPILTCLEQSNFALNRTALNPGYPLYLFVTNENTWIQWDNSMLRKR